MKRSFALVLFALCFLSVAYGQQAGDIKGTVYKKISSDRLANVLITNLNNHVIMMSDDRGNFSIKAQRGDTLVFNKTGFTPQKQYVNGYDMIVYLQPEIQLNQVVIRGQTKKQELNDIMGSYRSKGTFYDGKPPVLSFLSSPITGLYELFGKTPSRARRFAAFAKRENEETSVDTKYTKTLVMRVTGAPDSTATKFMEYYRPQYVDIKSWSDYDLINHIKKAYEGYQKNGDKVKLQKLY